MIRLEKIEISSYLTLILGVTFDHASTDIGISNFSLFESNYIAKILMDIGLWGYVDVLLCLLFIFITNHSYHRILGRESKYVFFFPLFSGLIRLFAGMLNISLFQA